MDGTRREKKRGTLRVVIVPLDGEPYIETLRSDDDGSFLHALQECVAIGGQPGNIEAMGWVFDDEPAVYCNEEGKLVGTLSAANRALYATPRMVSQGIASYVGEVLDIAFGPLVCVGFDPETGRDRDITDKEAARVARRFGGLDSIVSGKVEALAIIAQADPRVRRFEEPSKAGDRKTASKGARQRTSGRASRPKGTARCRERGGHGHSGRQA